MKIAQICACILLYLLLKAAAFDFFFYIYNLHLFEQKIYSHQVLIYRNVPGIPVRKPLQNRQLKNDWMCEFRGDLCKLVDWETLMNKKDMLTVDVLT